MSHRSAPNCRMITRLDGPGAAVWATDRLGLVPLWPWPPPETSIPTLWCRDLPTPPRRLLPIVGVSKFRSSLAREWGWCSSTGVHRCTFSGANQGWKNISGVFSMLQKAENNLKRLESRFGPRWIMLEIEPKRWSMIIHTILRIWPWRFLSGTKEMLYSLQYKPVIKCGASVENLFGSESDWIAVVCSTWTEVPTIG